MSLNLRYRLHTALNMKPLGSSKIDRIFMGEELFNGRELGKFDLTALELSELVQHFGKPTVLEALKRWKQDFLTRSVDKRLDADERSIWAQGAKEFEKSIRKVNALLPSGY